jgi:hypothetical protein
MRTLTRPPVMMKGVRTMTRRRLGASIVITISSSKTRGSSAWTPWRARIRYLVDREGRRRRSATRRRRITVTRMVSRDFRCTHATSC